MATAAIGYSLLMYKEFFIGKYIRPHLTTYAVSHTVVTVLLALTIFTTLNNTSPLELPADCFRYAIITWLLFNIFEFGRKSFLKGEERTQVPSYSNIFGKWGAFLLVLAQALAAYYLLFQMTCIDGRFMQIFMALTLALLLACGVLYSALKIGPWGKIYRIFTSVYIVLIYIGTVIHLNLR